MTTTSDPEQDQKLDMQSVVLAVPIPPCYTRRYSRSRSRSFSPSLNNQNDLENYEFMDIRMCCHLQIFVKRRTPQTVWGVRLKFSCLQKGCVIVSRNKCKAKALPSYELHILELEGSNIFSLS